MNPGLRHWLKLTTSKFIIAIFIIIVCACIYIYIYIYIDRLCGLVVRVLGYRSGGPGSIPGTTRKKVVVLERGPLSFVSTTKEILERKNSGSCLESRRDPSRRPRGTLYPQKLAITSSTNGGRPVGIVRSRTQTMEFIYNTDLDLY
jgi:hypothetical protein